MRSLRVVVPAVAGLLMWGASETAWAAPDAITLARPKPSFYLYGSPLFFAAPIGDDDTTDVVDLSYQWGFGLGGMFAVGSKRNFGIGIGFGFEHNPATLDDDVADTCDFFDARCSLHAFRFLPELRLGGIWRQLYGYGYLSPGFSFTYARTENAFGRDDDDTDPGFNVGLGGGVQYIVWKGLFVGGEFGFDIGRFTNDEDDVFGDDYGVYLLDFKALVGYYFG